MNEKTREEKQKLIAKMKKIQAERGSLVFQAQPPCLEQNPQTDWKVLFKKKGYYLGPH